MKSYKFIAQAITSEANVCQNLSKLAFFAGYEMLTGEFVIEHKLIFLII